MSLVMFRSLTLGTLGLGFLLFLGSRSSPAQTPAPQETAPKPNHLPERDKLAKQIDGLWNAGKFDEAVTIAERALELERNVGDEKQGRVADALSRLAESHELQGGWGRALALRKEALAARERVDEKDNWRKANARLALAFTKKVADLGDADRAKVQSVLRGELRAARLEEQRKYAEAEHAAQEVRETYQALVGMQTAEVARMWNRIGRVRWRRNDARGAMESIERALATRRKVLPAIHPDIADSLNVLGMVQAALHDYAAAKSSQEESLAIFRKALPSGHSSIATSLTSLGTVQAKLRAFAAAKANFEEVLVINRQRLAPDNPAIAMSLSNLGMVQSELGEYAAAKATFEEALTVFQRARAPEHPYIDASLSNLGNAQSDLGEYKAAKASHERALAIRRKTLPPGHASIAKSLGNLGNAQRRLREFAAAKANLEEALAIFRTTLPSGHLDLATILNNLGMVEDELLEYGAAKTHIAEALAIRRTVLPRGHPDIVSSLNNLGVVQEDNRDFEAAKANLEEALAIRRKALPNGHSEIAARLDTLRKVQLELREYAAAKANLEEALAIRRKVLPKDHSEIAGRLNNLGNLHFELREYAAAKASYEEALAIYRKIQPSDNPHIATSLYNLGAVQKAVREYTAAKASHEGALAIRRKVLPPGHPDIALSLNNLGNVQSDLREFAAAKASHEEALTIRRKALPPEHPDIAASLSNLANVQEELREYAVAIKRHEEALSIRRKALPPDHPDIAGSLANLGNDQEELREYAAAKANLQEALSIRRKALPPDHPDIAASLNNLGIVQRDLREYTAAKASHEEALGIRRKALSPDHPDIATSLGNLGGAQWKLQEYAAAKASFEEALVIKRKALPPGRAEIAGCLNNLAGAQLQLGEYAVAKSNFEEALAIHRKSLSKDDPAIASALSNLAMLALDSNADIEDAVPRLVEAIDILQVDQLRLAAAQAEAEQLVTAARVRLCLHRLIDATLITRGDLSLAYGRAVSVKGSVTARQRWARHARNAADHETARLLDQLHEVTLQIAGLSMGERRSDRSSDTRDVPKMLRALSDERSRLERQLAEHNAIYSSIQSQARIGGNEVRSALPKGTVLVDLVHYLHVEPRAKGQEGFTEEQRMMAFVLRPDPHEVAAVPLGPWLPLAELINRWRAAYGEGKAPPAGAPDPGTELRKRLWEPLAKYFEGVRVVLISPDGPLNGLPWAALPGSKEGTYLIQEYAFAVVPVPQLLPELLKSVFARPVDPAALVVGNIDFDALPDTDKAAKRENHFPPLPGTKAEAVAVYDLFRVSFAGRPAELLTGKRATKDAFVSRAANCSHVLVATHGFFLPEPERWESPGLGQMRSLDDLMFRSELVTANPALRSGLVFAGANYEAIGQPSAFLTALEASELDLHKVDMAVLSACETALGKVEGGEGVLGLQRAFQLAGARTVVTSLWKVPDAATQALVTRFHRNLWEKKMAKLEALREAQLWLIKDGWKHPELNLRGGLVRPVLELKQGDQVSPFYWAAFVLSGDWR